MLTMAQRTDDAILVVTTAFVHYPLEVPFFYRGHRVLTLGLYLYTGDVRSWQTYAHSVRTLVAIDFLLKT